MKVFKCFTHILNEHCSSGFFHRLLTGEHTPRTPRSRCFWTPVYTRVNTLVVSIVPVASPNISQCHVTGLSMSLPVTVPSDEHLNKIDTFTHTTRNHLVYDEINSSQIGEKMSQNRIYDVFVTILDNVMEWASQIKLNDVFWRKRHRTIYDVFKPSQNDLWRF